MRSVEASLERGGCSIVQESSILPQRKLWDEQSSSQTGDALRHVLEPSALRGNHASFYNGAPLATTRGTRATQWLGNLRNRLAPQDRAASLFASNKIKTFLTFSELVLMPLGEYLRVK